MALAEETFGLRARVFLCDAHSHDKKRSRSDGGGASTICGHVQIGVVGLGWHEFLLFMQDALGEVAFGAEPISSLSFTPMSNDLATTKNEAFVGGFVDHINKFVPTAARPLGDRGVSRRAPPRTHALPTVPKALQKRPRQEGSREEKVGLLQAPSIPVSASTPIKRA
ncbi:hypothetical protein AXG93_1962s1290 [Marchantia polymorpha subsp. ruderalis]|uniref:Uncharacterized protein n=1 Tax=Marchantia polymorpha subsp. ruderalis TaxID=1480154 RepID=A0A176WG04_MARPO|nr:hypothetical protein AXG93_1962s1290 [Marchantia polymorpha subsp. ruderalis]